MLSAIFGLIVNVTAARADDLRFVHAGAARAFDQLEENWLAEGGLELITGGPSVERTEGIWGHVSLRFVGSSAIPLEDVVIEEMALDRVDDSFERRVYNGAFGHYPIATFVQTLGGLIRSYYFDEARGYGRTIVPSTAASRRRLLETLRHFNDERLGRDHYYFFTTNCTSYLARILDAAGFSLRPLPIPLAPTDASHHFRTSYLNPWPEIEGVSARRLAAYAAVESAAFERMTTLDLQRVVVFRGFALGANFDRAARALDQRHDLKTTEEVYGIRSLPSAFYQADATALKTIDRALIDAAFTPRALSEARYADRFAWGRSHRARFCRRAPAQCAYFDGVRARIDAPSR